MSVSGLWNGETSSLLGSPLLQGPFLAEFTDVGSVSQNTVAWKSAPDRMCIYLSCWKEL